MRTQTAVAHFALFTCCGCGARLGDRCYTASPRFRKARPSAGFFFFARRPLFLVSRGRSTARPRARGIPTWRRPQRKRHPARESRSVARAIGFRIPEILVLSVSLCRPRQSVSTGQGDTVTESTCGFSLSAGESGPSERPRAFSYPMVGRLSAGPEPHRGPAALLRGGSSSAARARPRPAIPVLRCS